MHELGRQMRGHITRPKPQGSPAPIAAQVLHGAPSAGAGSHLLFDFLHLSHAARCLVSLARIVNHKPQAAHLSRSAGSYSAPTPAGRPHRQTCPHRWAGRLTGATTPGAPLASGPRARPPRSCSPGPTLAFMHLDSYLSLAPAPSELR